MVDVVGRADEAIAVRRASCPWYAVRFEDCMVESWSTKSAVCLRENVTGTSNYGFEYCYCIALIVFQTNRLDQRCAMSSYA